MPRPGLTWNTRDDFLRFYRVTKEDGTVVTYGEDRTWAPSAENPELLRRADALIALGIQPNDRVLITGSGMGYLIEALRMRGLTQVNGLDQSEWVHGHTIPPGFKVVKNNVGQVVATRNALQQTLGYRTFNWVISESVLESYDDAEIPTLLNNAESLLINQIPLSHCVHIVFCPPFDEPGVFNEKTMAQWKAMRPTHTWMNAEGYEVA